MRPDRSTLKIMGRARADKHFNRILGSSSRIPLVRFGARGIGTIQHRGLIKCKLAHGQGYSLVVPDILFLGPRARHWFQPLTFGATIIGKLDDDSHCQIYVDVSGGHRVRVDFRIQDFVRQLPDGSELYRCSLTGPQDLASYRTGLSGLGASSVPYLQLFHHTSPDAKQKIEASGEFWGSRWNIQGTHKKLTNIAYVYFTPVDTINQPDDLKLIAMASDGILPFIIDDFELPSILVGDDWKSGLKGKFIEVPVYRASTEGRTVKISVKVESTLLSPQHLLRHAPTAGEVWYEVATHSSRGSE